MGTFSTSPGDSHPRASMIDVGGMLAPEAPSNFIECGLERENLAGLGLKAFDRNYFAKFVRRCDP